MARGIFLPLTLPDLNMREVYHIRKVSKPVSEDCHCGIRHGSPWKENNARFLRIASEITSRYRFTLSRRRWATAKPPYLQRSIDVRKKASITSKARRPRYKQKGGSSHAMLIWKLAWSTARRMHSDVRMHDLIPVQTETCWPSHEWCRHPSIANLVDSFFSWQWHKSTGALTDSIEKEKYTFTDIYWPSE